MRTAQGTLKGYLKYVSNIKYEVWCCFKQLLGKKRYCACVVRRVHLVHPTSIFPLRCINFGLYKSQFNEKVVLRMRSG